MARTITYAAFNDENALVHAAEKLKAQKVDLVDAYTPFPIHGLDEILGQKRSRLPIVCFIAASLGCIGSMWFQIWTSAQNWPINVGGKPMVSIPAFIPVTFEVTVLLGGLVSVAAFLCRSRLFPGKHAHIPHVSATDDRFWIAVEQKSVKMDALALAALLQGLGGTDIKTEEE